VDRVISVWLLRLERSKQALDSGPRPCPCVSARWPHRQQYPACLVVQGLASLT